MTGKTHLAAGILAATTYLSITRQAELANIAAAGLGAIYGALVPDIDAEYSIAKKYFKISSALYSGLSFISHKIRKNKSSFVHRGILHSFIIPAILGGLLWITSSNSVLNCLILNTIMGLGTHLLLDFMSSGISFFAPFSMKRIRLFIRIPTNGIVDHFIRICCWGGCVYIVWQEPIPIVIENFKSMIAQI